MWTHYAHDVAKDGNCFYACTVLTCGHFLGVGNDLASVKQLRQKIANAVRTDPRLHLVIEDLFLLIRQCPQLKSEFPFVSNSKTSSDNVESLATRISRNGVWASEVEHSIVQHMLLDLGISLITLDCSDKDKLYSDCDIEEQLATALKSATQERCVVFVHISNNHYMYITLGHERIPLCDDFRDHIRNFLESDSDDSDRE